MRIIREPYIPKPSVMAMNVQDIFTMAVHGDTEELQSCVDGQLETIALGGIGRYWVTARDIARADNATFIFADTEYLLGSTGKLTVALAIERNGSEEVLHLTDYTPFAIYGEPASEVVISSYATV